MNEHLGSIVDVSYKYIPNTKVEHGKEIDGCISIIAIHINSNEEWQGTKELLNPIGIKDFPYGEYFETKIGQFNCIFYHSGPTKTRSAGACQYAIDKWKPEIIFVLGTCGGVAEDIKVLDVILAEETGQYDVITMAKRESIFYGIIKFDNSWINLNDFPYKLVKGFLGTADKSVTGKNFHILRENGVHAADWETASIGYVCKLNGTKCCVVRGVSDVVSQEDVFLQLEDYKRNTFKIMENLIRRYLPALIHNYNNWKSNKDSID